MAKLTWNAFIEKHKQGICIITAFTGVEPQKGQLAADGRKMPTSYDLLKQASAEIIKGDWTSRKSGNGIQIVLADRVDAEMCSKIILIGKIKQRPYPAPCADAYHGIYGHNDYYRLLQHFGYVKKR